MKGMLIQCTDCGYTHSFNFDKTPEEIESQMNEFIAEKGWRFAANRDGFICGKCQNDGSDAFYRMCVGKPMCCGKTKSYLVLMAWVAEQMRAFKELDKMY